MCIQLDLNNVNNIIKSIEKIDNSLKELGIKNESLISEINLNHFQENGKLYFEPKDYIQIPYSILPIKLHPIQLKWLNSIFSSVFIAKNANYIDILYDDELKRIISINLIQSDSNGNFIKIYQNLINELNISYQELTEPQTLFIKLKNSIIDKYKFEMGFIFLKNSKIFKEENENKHQPNKDFDSIGCMEFLKLFENGIINVIQKKYISSYPKLPIFQLFENVFNNYSDLFLILKNFELDKFLIPNNFSITIYSDNWYITFLVLIKEEDIKSSTILKSNEIKIVTCPPLEFGYVDNQDLYYWSKLNKKVFEKYGNIYNLKFSLCIESKSIKKFFIDLLETQFPIQRQRIQFLIQKLLYGFKNVEYFWDVYPKPLFYNENFRYLLRLFGYHINLRKISYWSLPSLINFGINTVFGPNFKILILISDDFSCNSLINSTNGIFIENSSNQIDDIKYIDNGSIKSIIENSFNLPISTDIYNKYFFILKPSLFNSKLKNKTKLLSDSESKKISKSILFELKLYLALEKIKMNLVNKFDLINYIVLINLKGSKNFISKQINNIFSTNPLKSYRFLSNISNDLFKNKIIYIYPNLPIVQYLRLKNKQAIKELVPIFFDFTEF